MKLFFNTFPTTDPKTFVELALTLMLNFITIILIVFCKASCLCKIAETIESNLTYSDVKCGRYSFSAKIMDLIKRRFSEFSP